MRRMEQRGDRAATGAPPLTLRGRSSLATPLRPRDELPATEDEVRERLLLMPRYRVVLHNDDYHSMDHVVIALVRTVASLTPEAAVAIMLEAHYHGQAVVIVCPRETAEFYREGLKSYGLTCTIEPE